MTNAATHPVTGSHRYDQALAFIAKHPGVSFFEVGEALGIDPYAASNALSKLHDKGLLTRQRRGKCFVYMLPEAAPDTSALRVRIEELEQWQREAIAKHPDLAPPAASPLLLKARAVVAEVYRAQPDTDGSTRGFAERIEAGECDYLIEVRSALAALEAAAA